MARARGSAPARAGLAGHPSDGYGGATLSVALRNFQAEAEAVPALALHVAPAEGGQWPEGGRPLIRATVARLARHCERARIPFDARVRIRYRSTIPREVGLAGSSAIVIATLRALASLSGVTLERERLAAIALEVETDELGIAAGPQDRVVQSYGGLVFMDFDPDYVAEYGHGLYEPLAPALLPELLVAWRPGTGGDSGAVHAAMRVRFERGERRVLHALAELRRLAHEARDALNAGDHTAFAAAVDAGLVARASIYPLDPRHLWMIRRRGSSLE